MTSTATTRCFASAPRTTSGCTRWRCNAEVGRLFLRDLVKAPGQGRTRVVVTHDGLEGAGGEDGVGQVRLPREEQIVGVFEAVEKAGFDGPAQRECAVRGPSGNLEAEDRRGWARFIHHRVRGASGDGRESRGEIGEGRAA